MTLKAPEASGWLLLERLLQLLALCLQLCVQPFALRLKRCVQLVTLLREPCVQSVTLLLAILFVLCALPFERVGSVLLGCLNLPLVSALVERKPMICVTTVPISGRPLTLAAMIAGTFWEFISGT